MTGLSSRVQYSLHHVTVQLQVRLHWLQSSSFRVKLAQFFFFFFLYTLCTSQKIKFWLRDNRVQSRLRSSSSRAQPASAQLSSISQNCFYSTLINRVEPLGGSRLKSPLCLFSETGNHYRLTYVHIQNQTHRDTLLWYSFFYSCSLSHCTSSLSIIIYASNCAFCSFSLFLLFTIHLCICPCMSMVPQMVRRWFVFSLPAFILLLK